MSAIFYTNNDARYVFNKMCSFHREQSSHDCSNKLACERVHRIANWLQGVVKENDVWLQDSLTYVGHRSGETWGQIRDRLETALNNFYSGPDDEMLTAMDIDDNGDWHRSFDKVSMLDVNLSPPRNITGHNDEIKVIMISKASGFLASCPYCNCAIPEDNVLLITERLKLLPTRCCNKLIWYKNEDIIDLKEYI